MHVDKALADPIRRVVDMLDRYVTRHQELVLELEQQTRLTANLTGYEHMRAASNAKVARAKIAMYEPEIELLRHQLERWATDTNTQSGMRALERPEPRPADIPIGEDGEGLRSRAHHS